MTDGRDFRRGIAMRILSVRQSVCPFVKRVSCEKTKEKSVQIFIPYERLFSLVFSEEEWLVGATASIPEILGQTDRVAAKSPIFDLFSPVALQL